MYNLTNRQNKKINQSAKVRNEKKGEDTVGKNKRKIFILVFYPTKQSKLFIFNFVWKWNNNNTKLVFWETEDPLQFCLDVIVGKRREMSL